MPAPKLNIEQQEVFASVQKFLKHPAADTFVLKGYAGSGKTFLMQHLAQWLDKNEQSFCMLASTGRAATVLRGKTGLEAKTVHSELYHFNKVIGDDDETPDDAPIDKFGQMKLQFNLRIPDESKKLYIIDEASMLANDPTDDDYLALFGSGQLLQDFFAAIGRNKVIFVGDPAQLPPVNHLDSPALNMDWLSQQKRTALTMMLYTVERTQSNNDILVLAERIRHLTTCVNLPRYPKMVAKDIQNVCMNGSLQALFKSYVATYKENEYGNSIAIAHSNRIVQSINRAMRRELYGKLDMPIQVGDVLLVTQNNYVVPLTNGDFVFVTGLGEIRIQANLHFQSVRVKAFLSDTEFELLMSLDVLYSNSGNFTKDQMKAIMVDFTRRVRQKGIRPNTEAYKKAMMEDSYLNCLRATYGYAVTCHKAQGGEWNNTFLFLDKGMFIMKPTELCRWWYTAVTRTKNKLHLADDWWIL